VLYRTKKELIPLTQLFILQIFSKLYQSGNMFWPITTNFCPSIITKSENI